MRQEQIVKKASPRRRPVELAPLTLAPPPDTSAADDLLEQIDEVLAA